MYHHHGLFYGGRNGARRTSGSGGARSERRDLRRNGLGALAMAHAGRRALLLLYQRPINFYPFSIKIVLCYFILTFIMKECNVCKTPGIFVCARCNVAHYCSKKCQNLDWIGGHKSSCFPFVIKQDDESGIKYATALKDLEVGDIVLEEEIPIFHVPRLFENSPFLPLHQGTIFCVSCGLHLTFEQCLECTTCRSPVCSLACENLAIHKHNECKYFQEVKSPYLNGKYLSICEAQSCPRLITTVRTMEIKEKDAKTWEALLKIGLGTQMKSQFQGIRNPSRTSSIFPESKEPEMIEVTTKVMELIMDKGYFIHTPNEYPKHCQSIRSGLYLYSQASSFEQSCSPNCTWRVNNLLGFKIWIRVVAPIKKGTVLTVSRFQYLDGIQRENLDRFGLAKDLFGFVDGCSCSQASIPQADATVMEKFLTDFIEKYQGKFLHPNHIHIQNAIERILSFQHDTILSVSTSCTLLDGPYVLERINHFLLKCKIHLELQQRISPILYFESSIFKIFLQVMKCKLRVLAQYFRGTEESLAISVKMESLMLIKIMMAFETEASKYFEKDLLIQRGTTSCEVADYLKKDLLKL